MALIDFISKSDQLDIPKATPFDEMGVSGLLRTNGSGIVFEEWLSQLSSYRQRQVYREMRDNDAAIGSMMFALEMILRRASWSVEAGKANKQGEMQAQFVRNCMEDMSHTWSDFIAEVTSMFPFGFSLFETVYKRRLGPQTSKPSSKYNDGLIGWRKMAPRAQESILYWCWDDDGGLQGAQQLAAPDYILTTLPIESLLLFRTTSIKNNPEGRSLLRNCFRPWTAKKRLEEVILIGIERDVCGLPVLSATLEAITAMGGMDQAKRIVTNVRIDDQMGIVLPIAYDDRNNPSVKIDLIKAAGAKQTDGEAAIKRHEQEMFNTILAGFIQFGQVEHGSHSLHLSATQIFAEAISGYMDSIADVINRIAIPRLLAMNPGMDLTIAPKLVPGEIGIRDLEEISRFCMNMSVAGMTFFDQDTQTWARKVAKMPEMSNDSLATHELPLNDDQEITITPRGEKKPKPGEPAETTDSDAGTQDENDASEDLEQAV
jgi:hypothetical protein